jgi:hypothetical protein
MSKNDFKPKLGQLNHLYVFYCVLHTYLEVEEDG